MSASIGVASGQRRRAADDLLRNADMAMYTRQAPRQGPRRDLPGPHVRRRAAADRDGGRAPRTRSSGTSWHLVYQPIYDLRTGRADGVEALVRWDHPRFGALLPQHFIPLAEETGLIVQLGGWVLREACRQLSQWRGAHPRLPLTVAVNISGRQLHEPDIVTRRRDALAESGVDPAAVMLEITESVLMQQTGSVLERLPQLKDLGVRLAIDDFGTGYSSLSYLQRFPIDILKIAKPFVEEVATGGEHSALARAIIGLGETLRLVTVAEGVERADQCAALVAWAATWDRDTTSLHRSIRTRSGGCCRSAPSSRPLPERQRPTTD